MTAAEYAAMIAAIRSAHDAATAARAAVNLGWQGEAVDALDALADWLDSHG